MTIAQVLYMLEAARCQNISQAAGNLFISQSALSQQLRRLEQELGYPLYTRSVHGLRLTAEGERFVREAKLAAAAWEHFQRAVLPGRRPVPRYLRIGMGARVYSNGLFHDVLRFLDERPGLEVTFIAETGRDPIADLLSGELDLALDRFPEVGMAGRRADLYVCDLVREEQCVLLAPDDPNAALAGMSFQELRRYTMISGPEGSMEDLILREIFQRHGADIQRVIRSDGTETLVGLVREGRGAALGPRSCAEYYHVAAVPLLPIQEDCLKFVCMKKQMEREEIMLLLDFLRSVCRDRGILAGETGQNTL